jgi:hypothetical protein
VPIASLKLTSGTDIFGFDGDGLCTYITCTWPHPTGYEGPGVSFNILSATSGTVNFNPPIPANGGTAYFSLEESLTSATACTSVINNSVHKVIDQNGTRINATFTSNTNLFYNLTQAATLCGFAGWDWQQTITSWPRQSSLFPIGSATPKSTPPPFLDPVPGGYTYNLPAGDHSYPFYLDPNNGEVQSNEPGGPTGFVLNFSDTPTEPCLPGGPGAPSCPTRAPAGSKLGFTTHLVGLVGSGPGWGVQDTGIGFSWTSTFNGTSGGVATTKNFKPVDPGSGTGGITITMVNDVSSYQYPKSFGVSEINGNPVSSGSPAPPLLLESQIATTSTGLAYSRVTQTFNATLTITNVSSSAIAGPLQVVFDSLTAGVTLANATSSFGGWPFITVPGVGSLAPGQSASVNVQFKNPSNAVINASPVVYSGTFN